MEQVKISLHFDKRVEELSRISRRKLTLAMSLIGNSKFLFFDEPTIGLDTESKKQFIELLQKIKDDKIIIISTSDVKEAEQIAEKVAII